MTPTTAPHFAQLSTLMGESIAWTSGSSPGSSEGERSLTVRTSKASHLQRGQFGTTGLGGN
jgi:hypothetical protein